MAKLIATFKVRWWVRPILFVVEIPYYFGTAYPGRVVDWVYERGVYLHKVC